MLKIGVSGSSKIISKGRERKMQNVSDTKRPVRPRIRPSVKRSFNQVEDGYCKFGDLWDVIKFHRVDPKFSRDGLNTFLDKHRDEIPLEPGVVIWNIQREGSNTSESKPSRGLSQESCKKAIRLLCQEGYIKPTVYRLPPRFGTLPVLDLTAEPQEKKKVEYEDTGRERWSVEANGFVVSSMEDSIPPGDIVQNLVVDGYRREGLTLPTLRRQMSHMVPKYCPKELFLKYAAQYFQRTYTKQSIEKSGFDPGSPKSQWVDWQFQGLAEIAMSNLKWSKTSGRINCEKIAKILNKKKIRVKATAQCARNALRCLASKKEKERYGLTLDVFNRINNPKSYFKALKKSAKEGKLEPNPTPKPKAASGENSVTVITSTGTMSFLNLNKSAIAEVVVLCTKDQLGV